MKHNTILLLLLALLALPLSLQAQTADAEVVDSVAPTLYRYRVSFTDKRDCGFSVKHPEAFLSQKSINRRKRYGLKVDEHDLPLTPRYLQALRQLGLHIHCTSKWNNTAVVQMPDTTVLASVRQLPFVASVHKVWQGCDTIPADAYEQIPLSPSLDEAEPVESYYGMAEAQTTQLNLQPLHRAGYTGKGLLIAVIDGGFSNADAISALQPDRIVGTRNFVRPSLSVYRELTHGTMVLSCISAKVPHQFVGTAPDANFLLLVSEDGLTEQLVEEDNWCAAVEYADSMGADIVTSSLGYYQFDDSTMSHTYRELDGRIALNSRTASLAASRGILLLNSAGNSGDDPWKKIGVPADATDMLAVGAVDKDGLNTRFSSIGNSADGRIKPDVMARGLSATVLDNDGSLAFVNGTSFSCPIMCGAAACLMQKHPTKRPEQLINAIRQSGNNAEHPDNIFGYGIPDMEKADQLLEKP